MNILLTIAIMLIFMTAVWIWYLIGKNPSIVDVAWPIGLMLLGLLDLMQSGFSWRNTILSLVLLLWGIRLGGFLWWTRIRLNLHDKRYTEMDNSWCSSTELAFLINYQLQGLLIVILSLPWYFIAQTDAFGLLQGLGILLALIAIAAETTADLQLYRFKQQHTGKICNIGLWHYSRHPNYFFEWLTWCGFTLCALSATWGWLAVLSPLTLYLIMTRVTGPMTERESIKTRGDAYLNYQRTTPFFFPKIGTFI